MLIADHYLIFDDAGNAHALRSLGAMCRHVQATRLTQAVIWHLDPAAHAPIPLVLRREGVDWLVVDAAGAVVATHEGTSLTDPRAVAALNTLEVLGGVAAARPIPPALWTCGAYEPVGEVEQRLHPFGYHEPILLGEEGWSWEFCPELIAEAASELSDQEFVMYLDYIRLRVQTRLNAPELSDAEIEQRVEHAVEAAGAWYADLVARVARHVGQ